MPAAKTKGSNKDYHRCLGRDFDSEREAYESLFPSKCKLKNRKTGHLCKKEHGECLNKKACDCTKSFQFYFCPFTHKWSLWDDDGEYHSLICHQKTKSNDNLQKTYEKNILQGPQLTTIASIDGNLPQVDDEWFRSRDIYLILRMYIMTQFSGISWDAVTKQVKSWVNSEKKRIAKEKLVPNVKSNLQKVVAAEDSDAFSVEAQTLDFEDLLHGVQVELDDNELFDLLCLLDDNLVTTEKRKATYEFNRNEHNKTRRVKATKPPEIAANAPNEVIRTPSNNEADGMYARGSRRASVRRAKVARPAPSAAAFTYTANKSFMEKQRRFPAVSFIAHTHSLASNLTAANIDENEKDKKAQEKQESEKEIAAGEEPGEPAMAEGHDFVEVLNNIISTDAFQVRKSIEADDAKDPPSLMADAIIGNNDFDDYAGVKDVGYDHIDNFDRTTDEPNESIEDLQSRLEAVNLSSNESAEYELLRLKENRIDIIKRIKAMLKKQITN